MPLSQFGVAIAHGLTEYLVKDNPTPWDLSDNLDMAQQVVGSLASVISNSFSRFWSAPQAPSTSPPRPSCTPPQYQTTSITGGGKVGVVRAMALARLFKVVTTEENLTYAVSHQALTGGLGSRRHELIHSAFNVIDTENRWQNKIIESDCDCILEFIKKKNDFFPSRLAEKILETIRSALKINQEMIEEEQRALARGGIVIPQNEDSDNDDDGFEIVPAFEQQPYDNSQAPAILWIPQEAIFKIIYDETVALKEKLKDEMLSPAIKSNTSTPQGYERNSTSQSPFKMSF